MEVAGDTVDIRARKNNKFRCLLFMSGYKRSDGLVPFHKTVSHGHITVQTSLLTRFVTRAPTPQGCSLFTIHSFMRDS